MSRAPQAGVLDVDAFVDALTAPRVRVDGQEYTGHLISHLEYISQISVFSTWLKAGLDKDEAEQGIRQLLGKFGFPPEMADHLLAKPSAAVFKTIQHFFALQRGANLNVEASESEGNAPVHPIQVVDEE